MRKSLLAIITMNAAMMAGTSGASAQYAPWCLVDSLLTGSWSCYYTSREQCQLSTGGNIGHCVANPGYSAPAAPISRKQRRN